MLTNKQIEHAWDASYAAVPRYYSFARAIEAAASAETEALRKDAERYRWLKEYYSPQTDSRWMTDVDRGFLGEDLDAAIDAEKGGA
jgi:hypothetical protein